MAGSPEGDWKRLPNRSRVVEGAEPPRGVAVRPDETEFLLSDSGMSIALGQELATRLTLARQPRALDRADRDAYLRGR